VISQTAEYALRAVVDLAFHAGRARTAREISAATRVPADYLAKVLKDLNRGGIVRGRRGPGGGFTLARNASAISVYDVLASVDPPRRIHRCPLGLKEHAHALCPLHQRLDDAMLQNEKIFRATTIADVTARPFPHSSNGKRSSGGSGDRGAPGVSGGLMPLGTSGLRKSRTKRH
jgi:Rrf2 family protein